MQPVGLLSLPIPQCEDNDKALVVTAAGALVAGAERPRLEALINAFVYELFFAEEFHAANLRPLAAAREAGLMKLADLEGPALARAADEWSRHLADPAHPLYATLFELRSLDAVRIMEGLS